VIIFFKKVLKRAYYIFLFNPKKKIIRKLSHYSIYTNPSFLRISSKPYISGDTFRNYSDHIFDETRSIVPKKVKKGDIIFLKTDLKEIFFSEYHKKIRNPYILITHNSDTCVEESDLKFIDNNIQHWFAMKLNLKMNKKISPIPAGLENFRYLNNGNTRNFSKVYSKINPLEKTNKILCSFSVLTNRVEREPLINISKEILEIEVKHFNNNLEYLNNLSNYKYNLCPEGNNFESHRLWETLFFENIPIVKNNLVNQNFLNLGVPFVMLNNWEDLISNNLFLVLEKSFFNKDSNPRDFLSFNFWKERIEIQRSLI
jgi:hypothetical protein